MTSIFSTLKSLLWALLLLGLIVYVFAVIFVQVVSDYRITGRFPVDLEEASEKHFGASACEKWGVSGQFRGLEGPRRRLEGA